MTILHNYPKQIIPPPGVRSGKACVAPNSTDAVGPEKVLMGCVAVSSSPQQS